MIAQPALFETNPRSARLSTDRLYRYELWRRWSDGRRYVNFIYLNPSTADEHADDPTTRKCVKFAKTWGYDALCITNLFAFRSTDKKVMMAAADPVGWGNNRHLLRVANDASLIVAAWSRDGVHQHRSAAVKHLLRFCRLHYLRLTLNEPWHPLYLPDQTRPTLWKF